MAETALTDAGDLEAALMENIAAAVVHIHEQLLGPANPAQNEAPETVTNRLARTAASSMLSLLRLKRARPGRDLVSGDFILRMPVSGRALRPAWPGCPEPANDFQIKANGNSAQSDVQIPPMGDVQIGPSEKIARSDVQKTKRRRGAQPGNRNRWVHGERSGAAVTRRAASGRLVKQGRRLAAAAHALAE